MLLVKNLEIFALQILSEWITLLVLELDSGRIDRKLKSCCLTQTFILRLNLFRNKKKFKFICYQKLLLNMDILKYGFFKKYIISWGMKLCWVGHFQSSKLDFPLIKTLERIRFSSSQNIGEGEFNSEDWKCPTQQSFIPQEINSWKKHILTYFLAAFIAFHWIRQQIELNQPILLRKKHKI